MYQRARATTMTAAAMATMATVEAARTTRPSYRGGFGVKLRRGRGDARRPPRRDGDLRVRDIFTNPASTWALPAPA
jgi:hypothetical protein